MIYNTSDTTYRKKHNSKDKAKKKLVWRSLTQLQRQKLQLPPLLLTSFLQHAHHFQPILCWSASVSHSTLSSYTNWLSPLETPLKGKVFFTSNTNHCVCTSNTRGKLWLPWIGERPGQGLTVSQRNQRTSSLALNSHKTWSGITQWRSDCWRLSSLSSDEIVVSLAGMTHMWKVDRFHKEKGFIRNELRQ